MKHYWEYDNRDKETRRKYNVGDILENAAICKLCGDYLRSNNRHDYKTCSCGNLSVDGGSWYAKRNVMHGFDTIQESIVYYD